jgi:hypothetical protein
MPQSGVLEDIRETRGEVEKACKLLESPSPPALNRCAEVLSGAISQMERCKPSSRDPVALMEALGLRRAVKRAGVLLQNALTFHSTRFQLSRSQMQGYKADGQMEKLSTPEIFCIQG